MCSKEGLNAEARPAGVRSKKLFTTAAAKGSIMGPAPGSRVPSKQSSDSNLLKAKLRLQ
jgi:hypothetical protein